MRLVWGFLCVGLMLLQPLLADLNKITSLSGDFTQEVSTLDGEKIVYKGKLYMKKPHFVRWDYLSPTPKELYSDGKQALIYEPLLEQVTFLEVSEKNLNFSTLLSSAKKNKDGRYYAVIEGREYVMEVDKKGMPSLIQYQDEFENHVVIRLSDCRSNVTLQNDLFKFKPPAGVQIDTVYQGK